MTLASQQLRFGVFELDTGSLELRREGRRVKLRPQPTRLLALLAQRAGELVTHDEIRREVWGDDSVVEFDQGVHSCIRQIRSALGDRAESPRFIQTRPKQGYVFLAEVRTVPGTSSDEPGRPAQGGTERRAALALLVAAAFVVAAFLLQRDDPPPIPSGRIMLAVLPFENLSQDPAREYFSAGLTEETIFQLARLQPERLGVIARTSIIGYKGTSKPVREIGQELGVDYVLEGSTRHEDGQIRITAQLIRVDDQSHVWADTYQRRNQDVFNVQGDIARRVADSLQLRLIQGRDIAAVPDMDPKAYDLYLQGRHQWNRFDAEGLSQARKLFEAAIEVDPDCYLAWAGLADVFNLMPFQNLMDTREAFSQATAAARRALTLNRGCAAAHNSLGFAEFYYGWNWQAADESFGRAIELEPGYAMAHHWYAGLHSSRGQHDEAIRHNRLAVQLDPLSLSVRSDLAWYYLFARRYDEAIAEASRALEQEPYHSWSRSALILAYLRSGRFEQARGELRTALQQKGSEDAVALLDRGTAKEGIVAAWRTFLPEAEDLERTDGYETAVRFALVGDVDNGMDALERARDQRAAWMVFLGVDPRLDSLRADPRFRDLLVDMNLELP